MESKKDVVEFEPVKEFDPEEEEEEEEDQGNYELEIQKNVEPMAAVRASAAQPTAEPIASQKRGTIGYSALGPKPAPPGYIYIHTCIYRYVCYYARFTSPPRSVRGVLVVYFEICVLNS